MKIPVGLLLLMLFSGLLSAQTGTYYDYAEYSQKRIDSLQYVFRHTTDDKARMAACRDIGGYYSESKTDSAFYFHTMQLQIAQKLNLMLWVADANDLLAYVITRMGKYTVALQHSLKAIKIAENPETEKDIWKISKFSKDNNPRRARLTVLANSYHDMGHIYNAVGDDEKMLASFFKAKKIAEDIKDQELLSMVYMNLGNSYFRLNKLDSALVYERDALLNAEVASFKFYSGRIFSSIGEIYSKKGDYDSARMYLSKSIRTNEAQKNISQMAYSCICMANLLRDIGDLDSSLYYARTAVTAYTVNGEPARQLDAFIALSSTFKKLHNIDSAFVYQELAMALKDSIISADKIKQFENIGFDQVLKVQELEKEKVITQNRNRTYAFIFGSFVFVLIGSILYRKNREKQKVNKILETTLNNLKSTQSQLIQSEKMASLGELTSGIAHEIQNPLNFVNNFSEVSEELVAELKEELINGDLEEAKGISDDVIQNLQKIKHHGQRASDIVKSMLQHSRTSSGQKEPTNINTLADEYLRLAYHGFRAKDKSFNAQFKTELDPSLPKVNVVAQDIGRVLLNLINNAFYVVSEKSKSGVEGYEPTVTVRTKRINHSIEIRVKDNGDGIPANVINKIFQPFFTTKPTGEGTGLGLSLSYDIITKGHNGSLEVDTTEGVGTEFIIQLPMV